MPAAARASLSGVAAAQAPRPARHAAPRSLPRSSLRRAAGGAAGGAPARPRRAARAAPHAAAAAAATFEGGLVAAPGQRYAVVVGRFNELVTRLLLEGALGALARHGVPASAVDVAWVPGAFELPLAAQAMARSGQYAAVVAIGVVVRGATAHYDAVVSGATSGLLGAGAGTGVPVVFGVLTCDTMEQALDRAGGKVGNKGGEAAATAVEMANLLGALRAEGKAAAPWA